MHKANVCCWCRQLVGPPSVTVRFLWLPRSRGTVCCHRPGPPPQYWHSDQRLSPTFSVSHLAGRNLAPFNRASHWTMQNQESNLKGKLHLLSETESLIHRYHSVVKPEIWNIVNYHRLSLATIPVFMLGQKNWLAKCCGDCYTISHLISSDLKLISTLNRNFYCYIFLQKKKINMYFW